MADANIRRAAIRTAVNQVKSGDTFTRRVSGGAVARRSQNATSSRSKKTR